MITAATVDHAATLANDRAQLAPRLTPGTRVATMHVFPTANRIDRMTAWDTLSSAPATYAKSRQQTMTSHRPISGRIRSNALTESVIPGSSPA